MKAPVLFHFPRPSAPGRLIEEKLGAVEGRFDLRPFPDGETYLHVESDVNGRDVLVYASLYQPNPWILDLIFLSDTLRALGATRIRLITPYLSYMRQDKVFQRGEALTSRTFAQLLSQHFDALLTVDPHLHRYKSLSEIYTIPTITLHAAPLIAEWIHQNVPNPLLIGPDEESRQWVQEIAGSLPFLILNKVRDLRGQVTITWPSFEGDKDKTPVFVDDIIASGRTMLQAVEQAKTAGFKPPICVAIHPLFASGSYEKLLATGVKDIATCNSIPHPSNRIDLTPLIISGLNV